MGGGGEDLAKLITATAPIYAISVLSPVRVESVGGGGPC
jgi:hypothetical protein